MFVVVFYSPKMMYLSVLNFTATAFTPQGWVYVWSQKPDGPYWITEDPDEAFWFGSRDEAEAWVCLNDIFPFQVISSEEIVVLKVMNA